jgi:hypothetical protein
VAGAGDGSRRTYTGTKLETADTAKGSLRSTAPVLDPTGGSQVTREKESGQIISLGDDLKGASTDAVRRVADG